MKRKKSKLWIFILIFVLLIFIVSAFFIFNKSDTAIAVTTAKVERRTITQTVSAVGKIEPEIEVKISSETSGEILFLGVKEGDTVKAGQLLVRIKPDILETQLEQFKAAANAAKIEIQIAKAELERAENDLKRITDLYKKEFASKQEFELAKTNFDKANSSYSVALARYEQSLATLRQAEKTASRTVITSPINGIVTSLTVQKGEKVVGTAQMAGTEMMRISDLNIMNAIVEVDENDVVLVKVGDTAKVEIDAFSDKSYKGIVTEVGHSAIIAQQGTQDQVINFKVKIRLIDKEVKLRPGMSCNVEINTETKNNVLAIPLQSVTVRETKPMEIGTGGGIEVKKVDEDSEKKKNQTKIQSVVFLKKDNKVKQVNVKTGISDKGFIEVIEGLKEGDEIVSGNYLAVSRLLQDGSVIKIDTVKKKTKK
ncbi:MAG: efflux RND transporter periplasmic adaptor subunit [Candidatus Kapabacteria bacterium]|nr:efflux RND transporter periplasmic adaptor subunit [Candidatus Kapabacteria bacterium]